MKRIAPGLLAGFGGLAIVALAVAWARPSWLPAWPRPGGPAPAADAGLYCKEHGVPEKFCTLCHEELKGTLLPCKEHGDIPEDICTLCHPEAQAAHRIEMCPKGHGLPKHFCNRCGGPPSASLDAPDDGWCATHDRPESLCGECVVAGRDAGPAGPAGPARACREPLPVVRLASAGLAGRIGLRTAPAAGERHATYVKAVAETAYDANRYAEVSPRVAGFLREVHADLGRVVHPGDVLATVDAAEVGAAKTQLLTAHAAAGLARGTLDRARALVRSGVLAATGRAEPEAAGALEQAEAQARDAEHRLRNLGLDDAQLARVLATKDAGNRLDVLAPIGGTVVSRHAAVGEAVAAADRLFAVADTSRAWLWVEVSEADVGAVATGQPVAFTPSGAGADPSPSVGAVTWVGAEVNPTTRTIRVRAELPNPGGRLRARQFGRAEIRVEPERPVVVVPREAVQRQGRADVVFLPEDGGRYRPRRVLTRPAGRRDSVEVTWGLDAGQRVVTAGAFLLKTEITRGAIGAGCCD